MPAKKTKADILNQLEIRNTKFPPVYPVNPDFVYEKTHQRIVWKCEHNHQWEAPFVRILQGKGCPVCSQKRVGQDNVIDLDIVKERLVERNKKYPDKKVFIDEGTYKGTTYLCTWRCEDGHEWEAEPNIIMRGSSCPECKRLNHIKRHTDSHDDVVRKLEERNLKNPNKRVYLHPDAVYTKRADKIRMVCDEGHEWVSNVGYVLDDNAGCPICARSGYSSKAIDWLEDIVKKEGIDIIHVKNTGEYCVPGTKYRVDGYCKATNTIYEFYGDMWHGNPALFFGSDINPVTKTSYAELLQKTLRRERELMNLGYNIIVKWESEWDKERNNATTKFVVYMLGCILLPAKMYHYVNGIDIPLTVYFPEQKLGIKLWEFDSAIEQKIGRKMLKVYKEEMNAQGITLLQIFEDEWINNKDLVISKIKHYLGISGCERIYARQCVVREIGVDEKNQFLNANHVQGADGSQIKIGGFCGNELVGVMTFSAPRSAVGNVKNSVGKFELVRFATHNDYHVVGIASKLLKYFQRNYKWKEIYSFADARWSVGNLYEKLGFTLVKINDPDYFYIVGGKRMHRWNYRKDMLKVKMDTYDANLTEYQNMLNCGFDRVWGVGTMKYEVKNNG